MRFLACLALSLLINLVVVIPVTAIYLIPASTNVGNVLAQMATDSGLIGNTLPLVANR